VALNRIVLGHWGDDAEVTEELVVCRRSQEQIEVHCHGGLAAVSAVMDRLIEHGCRRISWQEWLHESAEDPIRIAAQIALVEAPTARTAAILLDQFHGAFSAAVQTAIGAVAFGEWARASTTLDAALAFREVGLHLTTPWRVVLAGRTNVGKSSLMNAIAGFQRAIVSPQPGTTRDVVTLNTAIDGWPIQFADTAGLRETEDALESAGISLAMAAVTTADLVVAISDATEWLESPGSDGQVFDANSQFEQAPRAIRVLNKGDLLASAERAHATTAFEITPDGMKPSGCVLRPLFTSAKTGEGIADLVSAISRALVPQVPSPGSAVPFLPQQISALEAARGAIDSRDSSSATVALQSLLAPAQSGVEDDPAHYE
jgi:tRNA modification GTPase